MAMKTTVPFGNHTITQRCILRFGKRAGLVTLLLVLSALLVLLPLFVAAPALAARSQVNMRLLQQAAQADRAEAQVLLAFLYANGEEGLPQDAKQAATWYLRAADQGNVEARFRLGMLYLQGGPNLSPDAAQAEQHLRKAAEQQHVEAQYRAGLLEARGGPGLSPKPDRGLTWLSKAAEGGHPAARALLEAVDAAIQAHQPAPVGIPGK